VADRVDAARDELYGLDPDEFMARRGELTQAAKSASDTAAAKTIGGLRKPTRSAYAVNLLVRAQPDAPDRLEELAGRLRDAQRRLDGGALRELSIERNKLVDELARAALKAAGKGATAALRDEIAGTISAAIADPEVLERMRSGALVRAESWSGLGVADGPSLTLVHSAPRERPAKAAPRKASADDDATSARTSAVEERARRRHEERRRKADEALAEAEQKAAEAAAEVSERRRTVRRLEQQLAEAGRRLADAESVLRQAEGAAKRARSARDAVRSD
jgi:hypothetical protein